MSWSLTSSRESNSSALQFTRRTSLGFPLVINVSDRIGLD
jgi:hypothetical protein